MAEDEEEIFFATVRYTFEHLANIELTQKSNVAWNV